MGIFSAGAVGVDLTAHVARKGFDEYVKYIGDARVNAGKGVHTRLGGDFVKDGFERYGRAVRAAQTEGDRFAAAADKQAAAVSDSFKVVGDSAGRYLTLTRDQLGLTRNEFISVAEAAAYSARQQEEAYAKAAAAAEESGKAQRKAMQQSQMGGMGGGGTRTPIPDEKFPEDHGKKAGEAWKKGFESTANMGKWSLLGLGGVALLTTKVAADFQKQMELAHTQAGYLEKDIQKLSPQVLKLATEVGIGPTKLAEGLFHIASSGIPAAKAMETLRSAAELAKVGDVGMEETTNALVAVMKTAPKDIKGTTEAVAVMNDVVGHGNMRMKDLVGALTTGILPAAKAVGLGFRDVGAALDVMTARGIPAEEGATRLRTTLSLIAHPTAKAEKALMQLGLTHNALAKEFESHGLVGGLEALEHGLDKAFPKGRKLSTEEEKKAIEEYAKSLEEAGVTGLKEGKALASFERKLKETGSAAIQQGQIISEAFGGARIGTTMQILMQNVGDVRAQFHQLHDSKDVQRFSADFKKSMETMSGQASQFWADLQVLGVKIGNKLIPVFEKLLKVLIDTANYLGKHKTLADVLGIAFGTVLVAAITAFFARFFINMGKTLKQMGDFGVAIAKLPMKMGDATSKIVEKLGLQQKALQENVTTAQELNAELGRLAQTGESVTAGGVILPKTRSYSGTSSPVSAAEKGLGGVEGVRGPGGGTMMNPIAVAVEASEYTGMGSRGAANEANQPSLLGAPSTARNAEEATKQATGEAGSAAAAADVAAVGGASSTGSKLMMGAMKGAGIFFGGQLASNIAGEAIGGKVGQRVSGVGTDVAMGAGIGMMVGPEGAAAGAAIGGIVGALTKIPGVSKAVGDAIKSVISWFEHLWKTSSALRDTVTGVFKGIEEQVKGIITVFKGLWEIIEGIFTGNWKKIWQGVKDVFKGEWEGIKGEFKVVWAQIKGTFELGTKAIEALWGAFWKLLTTAVSGAGKGIAAAAKAVAKGVFDAFKAVFVELPEQEIQWLEEAAKAIASLAKEFFNEAWTLAKHVVQGLISGIESAPDAVVKAGEKVGKSILDSLGSVLEIGSPSRATKRIGEYIVEGLEHGLKNTSVDKVIERSFTKLAKSALSGFEKETVSSLSKTLGQMEHVLNSGFHKLGGSFGSFDSSVGRAMHTMDSAVEAGLSFIIKETNSTVTAMGGKAINVTLNDKLKKHAVGGIPNPGSGSADDHILFDPSGNPIAALSGTEGIVNEPQMGIIDHALGIAHSVGALPWRGLNELWSSGMRHFAEGGKVGYPKTVIGRANLLEALKLPYLWGGHHGERGPIFNPRPGLDCSSSVSYVLGIPPRVSGEFEHFGKSGPGPITIYSNPSHVFMHILGGKDTGFFGTSGFGHPSVGGGPAWFTTAPDESYLKGFKVTSVGADFGGGLAGLEMPVVEGLPKNSPVVEIIKGAISKGSGAAESFYTKSMEVLDKSTGQNLNDVPESKGNIMQLAKKAAETLKVPWEPNILRTLLGKESGGGRDLPPQNFGGGLDPAGPMQIISSTFAEYELPGHTNRMNVWDNLLAGFNYIKHRYGTLSSLASTTGLMTANYKGYKLGGLLRKFAGGGHISVGGRKESGPLGVLKTGAHKRNPQGRIVKQIHPKTKSGTTTSKTHLPARTGHAILPHSTLKQMAKLKDVPPSAQGHLNELDEADKAIASVDSTYSEQEGYFKLVDSVLTPADVATLTGLRTKQLELVHRERGIINQTGMSLEEAESNDAELEASLRNEAKKVLREIHQLQNKLTHEGRKLAMLRHKRAGKLLALAEAQAKKEDNNKKKREEVLAKEANIRTTFRHKLENLRNWTPPDTSGETRGIHERYAPRIAAALTPESKRALQNQERQDVDAVHKRARAIREAHAREVRRVTGERDNELAPLDRRKRSLQAENTHIKEHTTQLKQKYAREGWAQAWEITTAKWKLEDELKKAKEEEKALSGSETVVGTGGALAEATKAVTAIKTDREKLDEQEASSGAQELADAQDIAQLDVSAGIPIPQSVLEIFQKAGLTPPSGLAAYQAGIGTAAATTTPATEEKTPAEIAKAALEDLANFESAAQQIFSQFGSNTLAPSSLSSSLGMLSGGVRYFGAAGASEGTGAINLGGAPPPPTSQTVNNFTQNNTYAVGPQDPHIHAQQSKAEFESALG